MTIKWLGHACFVLTNDSNFRILIDPYDATVGYGELSVSTDVVISTHDHFDHNCFDAAPDAMRITGAGKYSVSGVEIEGFDTWHDHHNGAHRGRNTVYRIVMDGVTLCHTGDLGFVPSPGFFASIGSVDVLMLPVGGVFTIDAAEALNVVRAAAPNIILPMHYLTPAGTNKQLAPVDAFLERARGHYDISRSGSATLTVAAGELKKRPRIIVLETE